MMLSTPGDLASYPQVAFDRQGNATAVWMELKRGSGVKVRGDGFHEAYGKRNLDAAGGPFVTGAVLG